MERTNYEVVVRTINRLLNEAMGREPSNSRRVEWSREELRRAREAVPRIGATVRADFGVRLKSAGITPSPIQREFNFDDIE